MEAPDWLIEIGKERRFTEEDISQEAYDFAIVWLRGYDGQYPYLKGLKNKLKKDGHLKGNDPQGVLNCWRVNALYVGASEVHEGRFPHIGKSFAGEFMNTDQRIGPLRIYSARHSSKYFGQLQITRIDPNDRPSHWVWLGRIDGKGTLYPSRFLKDDELLELDRINDELSLGQPVGRLELPDKI